MSEIPMYPDEIPADDERCFCGAEWNDLAEECAEGHPFGEADKFRVRAEKAEALNKDLASRLKQAQDLWSQEMSLVQGIRNVLENYENDEHLRADTALGAIYDLVNP